jgi:hypothetical protein
MLISDSGSESILKSVLAREGLSGIIPFEQEVKTTSTKRELTRENAEMLGIACQSKRFMGTKR